jgi:DNA-binding MarR family transcriptional regulator
VSDPIDTTDPLALDQQVCFALSVAARSVVAVYRPLLEPMGLTHPQYLVMLALWQHAPLSVRQLSELLQLDPGTLSPLLKRLEAIGYLRRERDRADERSLALTLTPSGRALRSRAEQIPRHADRGPPAPPRRAHPGHRCGPPGHRHLAVTPPGGRPAAGVTTAGVDDPPFGPFTAPVVGAGQ